EGGRERETYFPQITQTHKEFENKSNVYELPYYYIMCMVAITFLNLIGIPMEIAFLDGYSGVGWEGFNVFSDTLFLMDVALNFRMGIISEDSEVAILDIKKISVIYLKSWFIPDVIAAFPIGYILLIAELQSHSDTSTSGSKASRMVRILMFVRIISLVRLLRVSRLVRFFNEVSNANLEYVQLFFRILSLFMMMFLLCHWNGCIQYFVPMLEEFPSDCWNATVGEKYSFGVFRALSHMIQISYGSTDFVCVIQEILTVMCSSLLNNVPMFQNRDVNFLNTVLLQFQHEVFQEDDVIFHQNAPGDRMFFIEHGQVLVETDSFPQELADGDYFGGQTCLMTKGKRLATVRALTTCQLFSLSSDRFQRVLQSFPDIRRDMEKYAQQDKEDVIHL
uniref:Cyclic nucleotide-binding domain-containing protein n=1 Tax=Oncorhynchus tshawytscha TaxID=74940 RepID=A0AAZ3SRF5_ONCTS